MTPKERLAEKRGSDYYGEFDAIMCEGFGEKLRQTVHKSKQDTDDFNVGQLTAFCTQHDLPFKPTLLWMEKNGLARRGIWHYLERNGFSLKKVRQFLEADLNERDRQQE